MNKFKNLSGALFATAVAAGIMVFMSHTAMAAGDVEINETNFPDANFRNYLLEHLYGYDGVFTESEIASINQIYVGEKSIKDLTGIEYFTELDTLDCHNNKLTSLDVTNNTKLHYLYCNNNQIENLNIRDKASYTNLDYGDNPIKYINGDLYVGEANFPDANFRNAILSRYGDDDVVSKNEIASTEYYSLSSESIKDLTGIEYFTFLKELSLYNNEITSLDVSALKDLEHLDCSYNKLSELDVSKNKKLKDLRCDYNELSKLDVSNNTELEVLYCSENKLNNLDVSKNASLSDLRCNNNNLTDLDVNNNVELVYLFCVDNKLTSLDVCNNYALTWLYCESNKLTSLDVSNNYALTNLYCGDNELISLDVSNNILLADLRCSNNKINILFMPLDSSLIHSLYCDEGVEKVVLLTSDWKLTGVQWSENYVAPSKTTATALFVCTKEGFTDYKVSVSMSVENITSVAQTCEKEGIYSYKATLPKEISRTGVAIAESKTFKLPATGHSWSKWTVKTPVKILVNGVEVRKCSVCGKEETRNIAYLTPTATPTATPSPIPPKVTITMDSKAASVVCGKTIALKATLVNSKAKVVWKSSDSKIASVDANGKVTGKKAGTVTITASAAGKQAACPVTIVYKDVTNNEDFWYAPTNYLTANGIVKGYDNQTNFKPKNDCTRAQMVTFLYRLQGEPPVKSTTCKFKDVKKTDYFFKPVIWAVEKGITTGVSKTKFDPQGVCTRAQTVTFLWRMAKKPAPKAKTCKFKDVKTKDYFYKPVIWASEKKIVAGYNDGTFKPQGKCLRRQMVTFLYKYDKFVNGKG